MEGVAAPSRNPGEYLRELVLVRAFLFSEPQSGVVQDAHQFQVQILWRVHRFVWRRQPGHRSEWTARTARTDRATPGLRCGAARKASATRSTGSRCSKYLDALQRILRLCHRCQHLFEERLQYDGTRQDTGSDAWGRLPRPGSAKTFEYPKCKDGRLVADVVRMGKGHAEGLEPHVTEQLVKLIVSAKK